MSGQSEEMGTVLGMNSARWFRTGGGVGRFFSHRSTVWVFWVVLRLVALTLALSPHVFHYDIMPFFTGGDVSVVYLPDAQHMHQGMLPYRDFSYEYPPGTLPLLYLAGLWTSTNAFCIAWSVLMLGMDLLVMLAARKLSVQASWVWTLGGAALIPLALVRNDLVVVAAVAWMLVALKRSEVLSQAVGHEDPVVSHEEPRSAPRKHMHTAFEARTWAFLAGGLGVLGGMDKVWPLALVLVGVLVLPRSRVGLLWGAGVSLLAWGVVLQIGGMLVPMYHILTSYHGDRGVEVESISATWTMVQHTLQVHAGTAPAGDLISQDHGSLNLASTPTRMLLARVDTYLGALIAVGVLGLALWRGERGRGGLGMFAWLCMALMSLEVVVTKVLSPQYLLWLVVLCMAVVSFSQGQKRLPLRLTVGLCILCTALTAVEFPWWWFPLLLWQDHGVGLLVVRNALLVVLGGVSLWGALAYQRTRKEEGTRPSSLRSV